MERNYGGSGHNFTNFDANKDPQTHGTLNIDYTNQPKTSKTPRPSFSEPEELEEKVVAKTLEELDADILQAMENLSITDDDIKSSASGDQSKQTPAEMESKNPLKFPKIPNSSLSLPKFPQFPQFYQNLGEDQPPIKNQDQGSTDIDPSQINNYIQIVSQELLKELESTSDLDLSLIHI